MHLYVREFNAMIYAFVRGICEIYNDIRICKNITYTLTTSVPL